VTAVTSKPGVLIDRISLGAAVLFAAVAVTALARPETAILRLSALGFPAWPIYLAGTLQLLAAALLLPRSTRVAAAAVIAAIATLKMGVEWAYREPMLALESLGQAALAIMVLVFENRRR
jgi:hypothetical protein